MQVTTTTDANHNIVLTLDTEAAAALVGIVETAANSVLEFTDMEQEFLRLLAGK